MTRLFLVPTLFLLACASAGAGQERPAEDRSLSPYFFVKGGDPTLDQFPLKSSRADVDIAGVIARVNVTQVYANEGKRAIEALYVFPASTRAAVHGMKMTIGERVITAQIERRQEARRQYEEARQAGRTASLLEQQRPNVFQMNVANILPGDEVKVELTYTELLVPERGVYEFVYPTVVGPRYATGASGGDPDTGRWVQNPYLRKGEPHPTTFDFAARIAAGMPLKEVTCPSHQMTIAFPAKDRASLTLPPSEKTGGNRDVVVRYRLAEGRIETGMLLSRGTDESFFLCMVEPPRRFALASVPPREYVFIMDVSGSMNGFPIETSKVLLRNLLGRLREVDYFNVVFFSGGSFVLSPTSLQASEWNRTRALQAIEQQRGGGGTELLPALRRAFDLPRARPDVARVIVIATDGYVNVEREAFGLIRGRMRDASLFAFGIGRSVNRHLIEGMARVGEGLPFVVLDPAEAQATAARFVEYIESPLLTRVEVRFSGFSAYDLEPATIPDLFADRPIVLAGKFQGAPGGSITIGGFTGEGRFERTIPVPKDTPAPGADALRYLWARERLTLLADYRSVGGGDETTENEITEIGLRYNLLTEFTSFVAIDQHVRRQDGTVETVKQPLPLPQGVSNLAVGEQGVVATQAVLARSAPGVGGIAGAPADRLALTEAEKAPLPPARPRARISVSENQLVTKGSMDEQALRETVVRALAGGVDACLAGVAPGGVVRLRVYLNARGRVDRVELLAPAPSQNAALTRCLQATLEGTLVLPVVTGGSMVLTMTR